MLKMHNKKIDMNSDIWIQLITTVGVVLTGMFAAFRYFINQSVKRERTMLEYFEVKNGHMERISKDFSDTVKLLARQNKCGQK